MAVASSSITPSHRVLWLARGEGKDLRAVVVYAAATGLLSLAVPIAVQALVSRVAYVAVLQPVLVLTIFVFAALLMEGLLAVLQMAVVEWLQMRVFARTAMMMGRRLSHADLAALDGHDGTDLANRFFDVVTVQKAAATLLLDGTALVLQTVMGLLLLAFYHTYLLGFAMILAMVVALVVMLPASHGVQTAVYESKAKYAVANWLANLANLRTVIRHTPTRQMAADRMHGLVDVWVAMRRKHFRVVVGQVAGLKTIKALASALLLGVGAWLVVDQQLTLGQVVAAELIVGSVLTGLAKFGKQLESWYDLTAAADKLGHVIDLPEEPSGSERLPETKLPMSVSLLAVQWGHLGVPTGPGMDWTLQPGSKTALVADHGAGKSSLVDLIAGLRRPIAGMVRVDGVEANRLDLEQFRNQVAVVRVGELFAGTVEDNLRMGRSDISDMAIRQALQVLGLDPVHLPQGLDTQLTQGGAPLSGGQRRLLLLARAMLCRPRLLIVDAVLDGLDQRSKQLALAALQQPSVPWTLLICTHAEDIADALPERWSLVDGQCRRM
jgi:ABC-type bacteriocin/lantibiotic exporter with double-glycine peptidase domain